MREATAVRGTGSYYDILQVSPTASQEVIHAAYRALARSLHPDINASESAARRMQQLNAAYRVLGDSERRAEYDLRRARVSRTVAQPFPKPTVDVGVRGRARPDSPKRVEDDRAARTTWSPTRSRIVLVGILALVVAATVVTLWIALTLLDDGPDTTWTGGAVSDVASATEAISH